MKPEISADAGVGKFEKTATAYLLELPAETIPFVLTAKAAGGDELEWVSVPENAELEGITLTADRATGTSVARFAGAKSEASFLAQIKGATSADQRSLPVQVKISAAEQTPSGGDKNAVQVDVGEYDPVFAAISGGVFAVLIALVVWFGHTIIQKVGVPVAQLLTAEQLPFGSWTEQIGALVVLSTTTIGAVVLLVGAWLAALEVRGRLRRKDKTKVTATVVKGGPLPTVEDVAKVIEAASRLRGTVALILAGVAILLGSLWAAAGIDADQPPPAAGTESISNQL